MGKTVNRRPINVDLPSKDNIKQYFFNHHNWKGIDDNKNFLNVDQETFSETNNVYIDSEGLLKSRPSLKIKTVEYTRFGVKYTLSNIINVWTFERTTVYHSYTNGTYYLTFINKDFSNNVQVYSHQNIKLIVADAKIFVFSTSSFNYYDMNTNTYADATSFIHIPVTKVITDGIVSSSAVVESPNLLTTSYITKRLYTSAENIDFGNLIGKNITVEVDGQSYDITFVYNNQIAFVNKYCGLSESNFSDDLLLGHDGRDIPLVCASDTDSMIVCSYSYTLGLHGVPTVKWTILHTVDGVIFDRVPDTDGIIGMPKLSRDGQYCFVFKYDGPYVYSVLGIPKKYPIWTNLLQTINANEYSDLNLHLNKIVANSSNYPIFNQSSAVNGYFIDDAIFIFTYGTSPSVQPASSLDYGIYYSNFYSVYCYDGHIVRTAIFSEHSADFDGGNKTIYLDDGMPNAYICVHDNKVYTSVMYNVHSINDGGFSHTTYCFVSDKSSMIFINTQSYYNYNNYIRSCIKNTLQIQASTLLSSIIVKFIFAIPENITTNSYEVIVSTSTHVFDLNYSNDDSSYIIKSIFTETGLTLSDIHKHRFIFSHPNGYLLTNKRIFCYSDYTASQVYTPLNLLFEAMPIDFYYSGNIKDSIYVATDSALYANISNNVITVSELTEGEINYFVPDYDTVLSNYYFAKGNILYISSPAVQLNVNADKTISQNKIDFEWYFPEINKQEFDYNITNLHPISNSEVAVFFEHSVDYVSWDSEISAYRYYKSKLQTGCKPGCDVLTTYDGKFIVFTCERGLVALSSQEFIATTEQAISYLSDNIFDLFETYITENNSSNEIKLFKHAFWIMAYKNDSSKVFVLDIRNNSWWLLTLLHNPTKLVKIDDEVKALLENNLYDFNKNETEYYDYDGSRHNISWSIKSQKLHLGTTDYYKHIVNMTFVSVHDKDSHIRAIQNIDNLNFKLQVNNYRKQIDGNIGDVSDYSVVEYNIESARTYVQRLNYFKVNEFQYLLSSNDRNRINIPLSLNSITVKYKIGTQVR